MSECTRDVRRPVFFTGLFSLNIFCFLYFFLYIEIMKTIAASTLCIIMLFQLLGPFFSPSFSCEKGVLFANRGPLFGKTQVLEVFQSVAISTPCAPGVHRPPATLKEYDI
jgi:hypothetical protein